MNKITTAVFSAVIVSLFSIGLNAGTLSALQILKKVDNVMNSPRDQTLKQKVILINRKGKKKVRIMKIYQKGDSRRLARFLSPASQKGIAFLSLPNDLI